MLLIVLLLIKQSVPSSFRERSPQPQRHASEESAAGAPSRSAHSELFRQGREIALESPGLSEDLFKKIARMGAEQAGITSAAEQEALERFSEKISD